MSQVPHPPHSLSASSSLTPPARSFYWWIDGVAGFLAFTGRRLTLGQSGTAGLDIEVLADVAPVHLELEVGRSGVLFRARAPMTLNGKSADQGLLHDGDELGLGSLRLTFRQPIAWSTTSMLRVSSGHRLERSVDAILLLGESCVLGKRQPAHVRTPWDPPVVVHWQRGEYWVRVPGTMVVNGTSQSAAAPLPSDALVEGDWGSFRWEPRER